ncbi:translation initiation factor eIF-2B epsilon subunit isoform 1 [Galdieria sulphuraria]|uniref:Translation initiation factor eIF2B subunit epsilon n=1 Tax=Galdieria sulphuraria TaxID=130081 RepID=M2Y0H7_GALSU|nr:translation initiation factor eIF-2B epsilon subunit isoform 1 [Galdieria sulphuraria]EME29408.1 translation initiation factor eIF-2B epsilon subunit isoform 1 [Galdieria sulphuraria]|eukprot:XP_005705928.1 translation initiation factor eIF-2B epsilon subunit isoform 1 [Galdieria sulphuraria]
MASYSPSDGDLKAVLFADFFSDKLRPPCTDGTFCEALLPIVNVSLLQYQLEALLQAEVKDCVIICREHIKETLAKFVKTLNFDMNLHFLTNSQWLVAGDAIRELDSRGDWRPQSDFILIFPGAFFTFNLLDVVKEHRARRERSKSWVLTSCFGLRSISSSCDIARLENGQIIQYSYDRKDKIVIPGITTLTEYSSRVEIFSSLEDCGIDICAPEVLVEFRENFDYDNIRDFIRGKIDGGEGELLGNQIYGHILSGSADFACRITNMESYFYVCFAFIHRWSYPWTVERFPFKTTKYEYRRGPKYIASSCSLAWSSYIGRCTVLGENTRIDENAVIVHSVIGDNVTIGPNCHIKDSIIWSHSILKSNVRVVGSLIADNVVLNDDCEISEGCIVDSFVVVKAKSHIPHHSRIILREHPYRKETMDERVLLERMGSFNMESNLFDRNEKETTIQDESKHHCIQWQEETHKAEEDDESSIDELEEIERNESEDIAIEEDREAAELGMTPDSLAFKSSSSFSPPTERNLVRQEIKDTFQRALEEQHSPETAVLELNALKLALDVTSSHILRVIFPLLLNKLDVQEGLTQQQVTQQWILFVRHWSGVLIKFCMHSSDGMWLLKYWKEYCEVCKISLYRQDSYSESCYFSDCQTIENIFLFLFSYCMIVMFYRKTG